jgi:cytoskeletal protein CcmA (bactofilin family)
MALGDTLRIKGEITAGEDVTIAGQVEGRIGAPGHTVTLAPGSRVVGDVEAAVVHVGGHLKGEILATDGVRIGPDGDVEGGVITARLAIADGGRLQGRVDMSAAQHALRVAAG